MLKNKSKLIALMVLIILTISSTFVFADEEQPTEATTPTEETTTEATTTSEEATTTDDTATTQSLENYKSNDEYICQEGDVTIDYIIDGNAFIMAENVTINTQIGGDVFVIAKNVTIGENGYIYNNLFTVTENLTIDGYVCDVYSISKTLTVNYCVARDLRTTCPDVTILGAIGRNVYISAASKISLSNDTNSEEMDENTAIQQGLIYGNLTYSGANELSVAQEQVKGTVSFEQEISNSSTAQTYLTSLGTALGMLLVVWLLGIWLTPKFVENTSKFLQIKPLQVVGIGILGLVLIPVIAAILIVLGITSKAAIALFLAYMALLFISSSISIIAINNIVCSKYKIDKNIGKFGTLIISGIIIWALTIIPIVGTAISFLIMLFGLGLIISNILNKNKPIEKKIKEEKISKEDLTETNEVSKIEEPKKTDKKTKTETKKDNKKVEDKKDDKKSETKKDSKKSK